MRDLLRLRIKRLAAMLLATGVLVTAVGCSSGNSDGTADVTVEDAGAGAADGANGATAADSAEATTMQISKYVGGVSLTEAGMDTAIRENMHLHNDNELTTAGDGSVDLLLDESKMVGLDIDSIASFEQDGKKLNCNMKKGAIYFYTTKKLDEDETFAISSSTMMVGIRGTSGYIIFNEETGIAKITLASGHVHLVGTNPNTGGTNEIDITAGQSAQVCLLDFMEGSDSVRFELAKVTPADLPAILVQKIVADPEVFDRVVEETGWSAEEMTTIASTSNCVNASNPDSAQYAADSAAQQSAAMTALDTTFESARAAEEAGVQVHGEAEVIRVGDDAGEVANAPVDNANLVAAADNVVADVPQDDAAAQQDQQQAQPDQQDQQQEDTSNKDKKDTKDNKDNKDNKDTKDSKDKTDSSKDKTETKKPTTSSGSGSGSSGGSSGSSGGSSGGSSSGSSGGSSSETAKKEGAYTISATTQNGRTVVKNASGSVIGSANEGDRINLEIAPNEGYTIYSASIYYGDTVIAYYDGEQDRNNWRDSAGNSLGTNPKSISFSMVGSNVSVSVNCIPEGSPIVPSVTGITGNIDYKDYISITKEDGSQLLYGSFDNNMQIPFARTGERIRVSLNAPSGYEINEFEIRDLLNDDSWFVQFENGRFVVNEDERSEYREDDNSFVFPMPSNAVGISVSYSEEVIRVRGSFVVGTGDVSFAITQEGMQTQEAECSMDRGYTNVFTAGKTVTLEVKEPQLSGFHSFRVDITTGGTTEIDDAFPIKSQPTETGGPSNVYTFTVPDFDFKIQFVPVEN